MRFTLTCPRAPRWTRLTPSWPPSPGSALRSACPVLAVWDDHDYGKNDAGADFPQKDDSKKQFLTFFGEPTGSPRWLRPGVYDAKIFGPEGKRVQVILLDGRYNRSPLKTGKRGSDPRYPRIEPYVPNTD